MSKKHISKEEIKEDVLVTYYARFLAYITYHYKIMIGIGVGILLAIGLVIGLYFHDQSLNHKAEVLMLGAQNYYSQADYNKALNGDQEALTLGFAQIAKKYSNTTAGNLAQYYSAVCELNLGKYLRALNYINSYKIPKGILGVGPTSLKGVILNDLGRYQKAGNQFLAAANWDVNNSTTPYNLLAAANSFIKAKEYSKAQKAINTVLNKYSETQYQSQAEKLKGFLAAVSTN